MPSDAATERDPMTIGAFSKETRLSLYALRLYDRLGLLPPAHGDEASGYRYYAREQAEVARRVSLLRQLGMPLQGIAAVLGPTSRWRRGSTGTASASRDRPARFASPAGTSWATTTSPARWPSRPSSAGWKYGRPDARLPAAGAPQPSSTVRGTSK